MLLKKIPPPFLICNSISILLLIWVILYAQKFAPPVDGLFIPPATPRYPTAGILTHTFEVLCSIPPVICGFTLVIIRRIHPNNSNNFFLLGSTILTTGLFFNEIYRIHIILQYFEIPKLTTIRVYGVVLILYLLLFWKILRNTNYGILLTASLLIITAVLIDSFSSYFPMNSFLIEGVPKLLGMMNFTLYFCLVCYQTILNSYFAASIKVASLKREQGPENG